jgi:hypothetical protein
MHHAFVMAIWKRPLMTRFCVEFFVKKIARVGGILIIIGSEGSASRKVAETVGAHYVEHENLPLGRKLNAGCLAAKNYGVDTITWLQTDDICDNFAWNTLLATMHQFNYAGFLDCYMYDRQEREMIYWNGYDGPRTGQTLGILRTFRHDLLDEIEWKPFSEGDHINQDGRMSQRLASFPLVERKLMSHNLVLLKGADATNPYRWYRGDPVDPCKVLKRCGVEPQDIPRD